MLPALTATANLNRRRARVDLSIHALQPSLNLPALASTAEFSLQVVAAPARNQCCCGVSPLFLDCELGAPCQGLVPSTGASPACWRRGCPRVARVRGTRVACNARVERAATRKPFGAGWKVCAPGRCSQRPSLNCAVVRTGGSAARFLNVLRARRTLLRYAAKFERSTPSAIFGFCIRGFQTVNARQGTPDGHLGPSAFAATAAFVVSLNDRGGYIQFNQAFVGALSKQRSWQINRPRPMHAAHLSNQSVARNRGLLHNHACHTDARDLPQHISPPHSRAGARGRWMSL